MANEQDYVDLGLSCADICKALGRGMGGKSLDNLSKSVCDAINQLIMWVQLIYLDLLLTMALITGPSQKYKATL